MAEELKPAYLAELERDAREELDAHHQWLVDNPEEQDPGPEEIGVDPGVLLTLIAAARRVPAVEAEPVAWRWRYPNTAWETVFERKAWFDDGDERLIVEPLYTAPPPAWKPPREAVARIIEPWAWGIVANIEHTERAADDRAKALKKADAILALQPEQAG